MSSKLSAIENNKLYFPQLDSIRGISFIAIFLFHTLRVPAGQFFLSGFLNYLDTYLRLGIEVFFVLSSFLLTFLGLSEYKKRNNFSFKDYFRRRALRIWPLYFFILFISFAFFPFLAKLLAIKMSLPNLWYYVFFISNFYTVDHVFFLRILWSISVEEQFYLVWGLCLRFLYKHLREIIITFFAVSICFSVYAIYSNTSSYFNTLTYLFDFACGGLVALLIFKRSKIVNWFKNMSAFKTIIFYSYLLFHCAFFYCLNLKTQGTTNDLVGLISRYLFIIYIALFILEQISNLRRTTFLDKSRFLIFTGKISYGLYCYHGMTITFMNLLLSHYHIRMSNILLVIVYFMINYLIATASYFYLENPFLKLKERWRRI